MPIIRTPDDRFENLPDYPFEPHYITVQDALRMHYVDEGVGDEVILCLHGEPSWSFLYRKMIPPLAEKHRVIAPDLIGYGRSDKYTEFEEYSFQLQVDTVRAFIEALDLTQITLVCQDWGGIIGLPIATMLPERFSRLVIMNTALPTGDINMGEGFMVWRSMVEKIGRSLDVGRLFQNAAVSAEITPEVMAGYEAPFPDEQYKAAAAVYPLLVPIQEDNPGAATLREARDKLAAWDKPALVMFSDKDPIMSGVDRFFRALIPTATDQPEIVIKDAGHFLQEDKGEEIAEHILAFIDRS